jgi:flagella basal body P-ring formation protein FlgA
MNRAAHIFIFVLALLCITPAPHAKAAEPVSFQLLADVQVDSTGIFLNQIVLPLTLVPPIRLAQAPLLGQTASLSRAQVIALANAAAPALDMTNWTGPDHVNVTRRTRLLGEAEMTTLLRATLQREYVSERGELEIHLSRPWVSFAVPDEAFSLQITAVPPAGVMPNLVVGFELWCGPERIGAWQLPLQAHVWRDIPVAHAALLRGTLLRDADITLERRDVLTEHDALIQFPVEDAELELAQNVPVGMPIVTRYTRSRPLVHRGQLVEALYQDGGLTISLKVETLEDGTLGQTVRVLNPKTHRELYGKVQNEDLILISL